MANCHFQTILPSLGLVHAPKVAWRREAFRLPDSDTIALDWLDLPPGQPPAAVLAILHGLEGSSRSNYARGLAVAATSRGWLPVVVHARDCGDHPNQLPRRYHAGETADPGTVFSMLGTRFPEVPLLACGYSLGGNTLLKLLGEQGASSGLDAAVAVSVPFNLQAASDSVSQGFARLYQWHLMRNMKNSLKRKFPHDTNLFDYQAALDAITFEEFDDVVTAPLHGFSGKDDYYGRCSSAQFLPSIEVPTRIIHALDDPFIDRRHVPGPDDVSPSVSLELTEHGGHVGFVSGSHPGNWRYWLPERICSFFAGHLGGRRRD